MADGNGAWALYEKLIISKLEEHSMAHKNHADALHRLEIEIVTAKTRASLLGFVAGSIPIIATTLYHLFAK